MSDNPYSRHYWRLVDDPKFAEVYGDDHHYATWSRLLMIADQAWPASAHLPAAARPSSVRKLAEVGLLVILPGGRYKLAGLDSERKRRSDHAQTASNARWTPASNAPSIPASNPQSMPSIEEHRQEEKRQGEQTLARENGEAKEDHAPEGELITWLARHGAYIRDGSGWHRFLIGLVERRGSGECLRGLVAIERANPEAKLSDKQWLTALADLIEAKPDVKAVREELAKKRASVDFDRRVAKTRRYIESLTGEHGEPTKGLTRIGGPEPGAVA